MPRINHVIMGEIYRCRDYDALTGVWMASVRATHDFLADEDIEFYRRKLPQEYMPAVELYAIRNDEGVWCAFVGLSDDAIEMLFVHPDCFGKGYGSRLLEFAIKEKGRHKVDVNEQNRRALDFYIRRGFTVVDRDETDGEGRPYPILHLELRASQRN